MDKPKPKPRITYIQVETPQEQRIRAARLAMFEAMAKEALEG